MEFIKPCSTAYKITFKFKLLVVDCVMISTDLRNRKLFHDLANYCKIMKESDAINKICIKYDLSKSYVEKLIKENRKTICKIRAKRCPVKILIKNK